MLERMADDMGNEFAVPLTKSDWLLDVETRANHPVVRLVLASGSPRRRELLQLLGLEFEVIPADIDERTTLSDPVEVVVGLAQAKAQAVAQSLPDDGGRCLVLGADTIVVLGDKILGKPESREEAFQMLTRLSGRSHKVYTGVSVLDSAGSGESIWCESQVFFRVLEEREIRYYVSTDEPMDKAGAYALQGIASGFVEKVDGCYTNIIGLPVPDTISLLRRHDVRVLGMP